LKSYLIVDDHPLFRMGLVEMLNQDREFSLFGEAGSAEEALELCAPTPPDIAFVDLTLNGNQGGLELVKTLHSRYPELPIIVISMHDKSLYADRAFRAGACGYVMKKEASVKIKEAVKEALAGRLFGAPSTLESTGAQNARNPDRARPVDLLTDRELEIFQLIGKGNGLTEIARFLSLSVKTVETHREHIKNKLNVGSSGDLRKLATSWAREKMVL
jgi:DNA-binding NarL/FixJ family response regulator